MSEPLTLWIIKKLFDAASDPIRKKYSKKFSELILGDPLENALRGPTDVALQAAVASALGGEATEEQRQRAFHLGDVLEGRGQCRRCSAWLHHHRDPAEHRRRRNQ